MRKADELRGPSCLTRAADDEPIFVLRANDESAPRHVERWAAEYLADKQTRPGGMTVSQYAKYREALALAEQMRRWKAAQPDA